MQLSIINYQLLIIHYLCPIQHFATNPRGKPFFSKPLQELPLVALQRQEKIGFTTAGFSLHSGAVT
ncbi:hypothetical protein FPG92_06245 [Flavobacterium psychrophilum]|nr:hypothetical protein FPG3_06085 [Flavobacterium psychrophilum FPG3]OUD27789.1 hypothetical protein FPG92_06245 [Flavobacterium psychrophilum]OXB15578.1 hypothetical protein B0A57_00230 [Flavobacterium psychrophilum DSM 3660 = ATCC 49418]